MRMKIEEYEKDIMEMLKIIDNSGIVFDVILGIGKGGMLPATYACSAFDKPMVAMFVNRYEKSGELIGKGEVSTSAMVGLFEVKKEHIILIIDDIADSGVTMATVRDILSFQGYSRLLTAVVYLAGISTFTPNFWGRKLDRNDWIHFPYDVTLER